MNATSCSFDPGLDGFTVADLCHPTRLTETVLAKLNLLPPGRLAHERLEQEVRLMLGAIRDAVCGGYRHLPLTALADFLKALHYFLRWRDRVPDTWDGGYIDDLEVVLQTLEAHRHVVSSYRKWLMGQPAVFPPRGTSAASELRPSFTLAVGSSLS